ncbi:2-oxoacid:acceptor oxidoreductase subunit alpha [bacterium (Candidatus Blackallbacteria) CG17_big_fil_post_rev_8_21_14_2_50_48_46]|uniref:2-oxoacid:acceptor oxidoreductase subunit alpha n=1 Tax=bacterium (Candidatus Blackallbacteria) CG17_big_fil_post_rev_8_21_14_2_50_48_46 TaxID=2014261 RepID=A0A2M7G0Y7_9BACT|nr:MAG: ferredoxin oxidoreductase [bacterium (Candidatus Blackallbacteria) CG18_big_fil_WC_8_21_14_2_50_49_26]PIW15378.1 MAG: 2-oxoacid:acceptor oxidoreductase subunit alpha [bacterium (Candidatus Blackallbacteria) CG17_big_fil_post_rev_8_21_14_2_50_48_46]PIW49761.1 MAG: 2-oxoacid:acceptor oxidoreductase subunit alpha [bacterium (Candidatus Blackallbacteria) CG13_big_fil_rev_8_21_14_2_50_49_14]
MNPQINDVNIQIATVNGTGSQSANLILMRSIFNMGIPVAAKNLFPSNIAGLPTWYTIRAHHKGYQASKQDIDFMVIMNPDTVYSDIRGLRPGAVLIHDVGMKLDHALREDHINYGIPFNTLVNQATDNVKLKKKVINMIYVGVLAHLLDLDPAAVDKAVRKQFGKKEKVVELNARAIEVGRAWAAENLEKKDPFKLEAMDATSDKILIEGNTASALGALMGGCTFLSWYPITPSSSVCETLISYFEKYRKDPATGANLFASVQAEDEIAAIGMILGAGWAGARSMTATSGPGISLMSELAGYGYYTEIPAVIVDVQRMGPSTGLPTRTSQGDLLSTYYLSHGDTQHPLLFPSSMEECYEMGQQSFDLAEQLQTPVFVMSELDLGMNTWMSKPFNYPTQPYARGKVLDAEALSKVADFGRYADVDGDGVPYRTLPGTRHEKAPYFTRGSGHDAQARYSEKPEDWQAGMERLLRKLDTARQLVPAPVLKLAEQPSEMGLIYYGSTRWPLEEALDLLAEQGIKPDCLRIRALPAQAEVEEFIAKHPHTYVVEQNRDGQMARILGATFPALAARLRSILHFDGSFLDARTIVSQLLKLEKGSELAHV